MQTGRTGHGAEARSAGTGPLVPLTRIVVYVSVCVHIPFRILTSYALVTDGKSIGEGWKVEFEFWKIYVTLRLNYFALYQRRGTQKEAMFTRVLLHGALLQWR